MTDRQIRFTGVTYHASDILGRYSNRKVHVPVPGHWVRLEVPYRGFTENEAPKQLDKWLEHNIDGRWASYLNDDARFIVLFFEDENDAILFKLKGGAQSYQDKQTEE